MTLSGSLPSLPQLSFKVPIPVSPGDQPLLIFMGCPSTLNQLRKENKNAKKLTHEKRPKNTLHSKADVIRKLSRREQPWEQGDMGTTQALDKNTDFAFKK